MMKTKRMSEVFELPIDDSMFEVFGFEAASDKPEDYDGHAAHAINHVDSLADALGKTIKMWQSICEANGWDEDHLIEAVEAKSALAAYRGEK